MTETTTTSNWHEANQRYLMTALDEVRSILEQRTDADADSAARAQQALQKAAAAMPAPPTLEILCEMFDLSLFERQVLLLCAGVELDGSFASACAAAQGDSGQSYPTFSLALSALPEAHWSALSPEGTLRRWRLVEVDTNNGLTLSPLRIDERILHYLTGVQHLDQRLVGFIEPVWTPYALAPSHQALAERLAITWSQATEDAPLPAVQLCGDEEANRRAIAAAACSALGLNLHVMAASVIPLDPRELEALVRLWEREAALGGSALLVECEEVDANEAARESTIARLIEGTHGPLIVAGQERHTVHHRPMITLEVGKPTPDEQQALWEQSLGSVASSLDGRIGAVVSQFNLSLPTIHAICAETLGHVTASERDNTHTLDGLDEALWDACRVQARPHLENLAQRIEPVATWDDLVLPKDQGQILREIVVHVRQRARVYKRWGFAAKSSRGLGISALFAGASGTGKTMAAEVLANELRLDLYHIDLSQVVSKYIGETEKNLRQVFDAAEGGGAILLFDEADALFGKRSEVKDSHDRYANIEVSYLLQRMEAYRGLAILTTNRKEALDTAFLRRIRFVVRFPFPDAASRAEIWRRIFPSETPSEGLVVDKLARLNVAGGNIRNIALYAAFLAAEAGEPVRMHHLLRAAQVEYAKLERPLTEAEIGGWV
jgi:SpoVK/Ycf46/Vps4 family AAA+-type ATPase